MHLRTFEWGGVTFGGFGGSWKHKPVGHHLFEQSEVTEALTGFPSVQVFVAHNSPRLIHERDDEIHLGFVAFAPYLARAKPLLLLHGHQRCQQETRLGVTRIIGTFGHRFLVIPS